MSIKHKFLVFIMAILVLVPGILMVVYADMQESCISSENENKCVQNCDKSSENASISSENEDKCDIFLDSPIKKEYQEIAYKVSKEYKVDFPLVVALMEVESGGDPKAISDTNDYGICQINICNHKWLKDKVGYKNILNAEDNIRCCCYMLKRYYKVYDLTSEVLLAYHLGGKRANELINQGITESDYTRKIMQRYKEMVEEKINE